MAADPWISFDNPGSALFDKSDSDLPGPAEVLPKSAEQSNDDEADAAFMRQFLPHIDPNADNPFDPSKFDEDLMRYVKLTQTFSRDLPLYLLVQIDLFRILFCAGYSLSIYDKII